MTAMHLAALGEIIGIHSARLIATGAVDADGRPILRTESAPVRPGESFDADPVTAAMLIRAKAAARAGSQEVEEAIRRAAEG